MPDAEAVYDQAGAEFEKLLSALCTVVVPSIEAWPATVKVLVIATVCLPAEGLPSLLRLVLAVPVAPSREHVKVAPGSSVLTEN